MLSNQLFMVLSVFHSYDVGILVALRMAFLVCVYYSIHIKSDYKKDLFSTFWFLHFVNTNLKFHTNTIIKLLIQSNSVIFIYLLIFAKKSNYYNAHITILSKVIKYNNLRFIMNYYDLQSR